MVKKISLTQGQFALVDDEDFEWLNQFKWQAHWRQNTNQFYAVHSENLGENKFRTNYMARMIMNPPKNMMIDHIDHNPLNNQKSNLRILSNRQNQQNQKQKRLFPTGSTWNKCKQTFEGGIQYNHKRRYLGTFKDHISPRILYEIIHEEITEIKPLGGVYYL